MLLQGPSCNEFSNSTERNWKALAGSILDTYVRAAMSDLLLLNPEQARVGYPAAFQQDKQVCVYIYTHIHIYIII